MPPKGSNSSKTAHVMNLLRKNTDAPAASAPQDSASATPAPAAPAVPAAATTPAAPAAPVAESAAAAPAAHQLPILTELNADAAVSSKIKDALESALLDEQNAPAPPKPAVKSAPTEPAPIAAPVSVPTPPEEAEPIAAPAPVVEPVPAPESTPPSSGGKLSQAEIERMLQSMVGEPVEPEPVAPTPEPEPTPPVEQPKSEPPVAPTPEPPKSEPPVEPAPQRAVDHAELINIMQYLAEEKAEKYIKMFGLCDCDRCRKDVLALTLNDLSAKYVVMPPAELIIRSDMYRSHYDGEITVQLLRACQRVMENPRHKQA